jgi:hypothetical protein
MHSSSKLVCAILAGVLTWGSVEAQNATHSAWTAVLSDVTRTGRGVWLASRTLRAGEFWTPGGSALDTAWTRSLKERGLILGLCELSGCPSKPSTTVVLLEAPRRASETSSDVRVVFLIRVPAACDSTRSDLLDMESFNYTLARRDSAWRVMGRVMQDAGHARDSAAVLTVGRCRSNG